MAKTIHLPRGMEIVGIRLSNHFTMTVEELHEFLAQYQFHLEARSETMGVDIFHGPKTEDGYVPSMVVSLADVRDFPSLGVEVVLQQLASFTDQPGVRVELALAKFLTQYRETELA